MAHSLLLKTTKLLVFLLPVLEVTVSAFDCPQQQHRTKRPSVGYKTFGSDACVSVASTKLSSRLSASLSERISALGGDWENSKRNRKCRCPDDGDDGNKDEDDDDDSSSMEDRREAVFAMMGSLWAASAVAFPDSAEATAGVDANMAFPDVVGGMNDRNTKQCLVESLGNRECLVYKETDPDKLLYKGVNADVLVEKVQKATTALGQIPSLVEVKKWNEITGILTGPMGELSSALTMLAGGDPSKIKLARTVKEDLFGMGTATTQRQPETILKYHALAIKDVAKFLEAAL